MGISNVDIFMFFFYSIHISMAYLHNKTMSGDKLSPEAGELNLKGIIEFSHLKPI